MNKKRNLIIGVILALVVGIVAISIGSLYQEKETPVETIRTISDDEFQFYKNIVAKTEEGDPATLEDRTKEFAENVYAQFGLAEKCGLTGPYSYSSLQLEMDAENAQREAKEADGEVVYGVLDFTLDTYLDYRLTNLKLDTVHYYVQNADRKLIRNAKKYWKEHQDEFKNVESITYSIDGKKTTVHKEDFSTLEKTDSALFETLWNGSEGDTFVVTDGSGATGKIEEKKTTVTDFDKDRTEVLGIYITRVNYDQMLEEYKKTNTLTFD